MYACRNACTTFTTSLGTQPLALGSSCEPTCACRTRGGGEAGWWGAGCARAWRSSGRGAMGRGRGAAEAGALPSRASPHPLRALACVGP